MDSDGSEVDSRTRETTRERVDGQDHFVEMVDASTGSVFGV